MNIYAYIYTYFYLSIDVYVYIYFHVHRLSYYFIASSADESIVSHIYTYIYI